MAPSRIKRKFFEEMAEKRGQSKSTLPRDLLSGGIHARLKQYEAWVDANPGRVALNMQEARYDPIGRNGEKGEEIMEERTKRSW